MLYEYMYVTWILYVNMWKCHNIENGFSSKLNKI